MNPIHLAWVPFALVTGLFVVSAVAAVIGQLVYYPFLGRFAQLYDQDPHSGRRLQLRVVIVGWGSLLLGFGFSAWSLFRMTQLINEVFADLAGLTLSDKLMSVSLPFIYMLIPYHLARFSTAMVLLVAPQDYVSTKGAAPLGWGGGARKAELNAQEVRGMGLWQGVDAAMTLLLLFFTPSAFKWIMAHVGPQQQLWAMLAVGGVLLLGSFAMSLRWHPEAWRSGNVADLLLLLGKLASVLTLFLLTATLTEVDLVEVALFTVLALWVGWASWWGQR